MTCWVPTLRAARRPARIHLRIVSGSFPTRRAASGTVIIVADYDDRLERAQGQETSGSRRSVAALARPRATTPRALHVARCSALLRSGSPGGLPAVELRPIPIGDPLEQLIRGPDRWRVEDRMGAFADE